jgi:hypothetical protein
MAGKESLDPGNPPERTAMNQPTPGNPPPRERLRAQWLLHAETVFDLLFADDQEQLVTFDQREERVIALTLELRAWLLEQHTAEDPAVRLPGGQTAACPKCGQPGQRRTPTGAPLPARQLTCDDGQEVTLRREQWHCKTCRVSFFPSGPEAPTGDGRL